MKRFYIFILLIFSTFALTASKQTNDVFSPIGKYIQNGDSEKLSAWFAQNLEIDIMGEVNNYSKVQAMQIMKNFFIQNPTKSFSIIHKSGSAPMKYAIGNLVTENANYRVTLFVKTEKEGNLIQQIRIEKE